MENPLCANRGLRNAAGAAHRSGRGVKRALRYFLVFLDLANNSGTFSLNAHHIPDLLNLPSCNDVLPP